MLKFGAPLQNFILPLWHFFKNEKKALMLPYIFSLDRKTRAELKANHAGLLFSPRACINRP